MRRKDSEENVNLLIRVLSARAVSMAKHCIACGACQRNCPQKLPIIEHLKQVEKAFTEIKK